ncbi:hypothetical protein DESUT3_34490 [Desulfuromonas versatilis]|uniref:Diguanylate cyclase/phosphodiesterase with PAS/PAC sensor(S) n=1 Tax=Desulfuromonas versatilis TaxID=2802975 RepID=A0ABM8HWR5_9BACT|nr:EAL domain-containing protein [Desulfuromonas versatilis]BCR06380.1 hypothetical protein DESUT3_34490 [Desulfuromonas versatilis]
MIRPSPKNFVRFVKTQGHYLAIVFSVALLLLALNFAGVAENFVASDFEFHQNSRAIIKINLIFQRAYGQALEALQKGDAERFEEALDLMDAAIGYAGTRDYFSRETLQALTTAIEQTMDSLSLQFEQVAAGAGFDGAALDEAAQKAAEIFTSLSNEDVNNWTTTKLFGQHLDARFHKAKGYLACLAAFMVLLSLLLVYTASRRNRAERALQQANADLERRVAERTEELTESTRRLEEKSRLLRTIIDTIPAPIYYKDTAGRYLDCNRAFEGFFGIPRARVIGATAFDVAPPDLAGLYERSDRELLGQGGTQVYEASVIPAEGQKREVMFHKGVFANAAGMPGGLVGTMVDITERRRAEEALQASKEYYQTLVEALPHGVLECDTEGRIVFVNTALCRIKGQSAEELVGTPWWRVLVDPARHQQAAEKFAQILCEAPAPTPQVRTISRPGGQRIEVQIDWDYLRNKAGEVSGIIAVVTDITEQRQSKQTLESLAYFDPLTGLPNRNKFRECLEQIVGEAREFGWQAGVLFLDLDRFKHVNDLLGFERGNEVVGLLALQLREALGERGVIARIGGDKFACALPELSGESEIEQVAGNLLAAVGRPLHIGGHELQCSASIGIAMYPMAGQDADTLLQNADSAMHQAKSQTRGSCSFYSEDMKRGEMQRLALETHLRHALPRNELALHYQPQVHIASGRTVGVEALLRWSHPELGMVSPATFIPVAEESALILPIGQWILETACRQARSWQDDGLPPIRVSVNISGLQLKQPHFVDLMEQTLRRTGLGPEWLELELTETIMMENTEDNIRTLYQLKALGVHLSMDDFGTGYSSLSYLKRFPIDKLKIDRSFVRDLMTDPDDGAIAETIIAMAHGLGLEVIAEGVETADQLEFLQARHCDKCQGYFFSKPLPAAEIPAFLSRSLPGSWVVHL